MTARSGWASAIIAADHGDVIVIPIMLARLLGLPTAAFLRQAAFLSAIVHDRPRDGWFFLPQEGDGNPSGETVFERLGSWQASLGIGKDVQVTVRRHLVSQGLLEEKRKGMVHGQLSYRVDSDKYLDFLARCDQQQTGNPVCTDGEGGLHKPHGAVCTSGKNPVSKRKHTKETKIRREEEASSDGSKNYPTRSQAGIVCWNREDREDASSIEQIHGGERVQRAVEKIKADGKDPLPSRVQKVLKAGNPEMASSWCQSEDRTLKAGQVLGLSPNPGEGWQPFRDRIRQALASREQQVIQTHDENKETIE